MATKTFEELKQLAIQIRDEKTNKQNTATRVGTAMLEHINKLEQDYYDKTTINNRTSEYNVSINHPTSGISSSNKYDLSSAIVQVPAELRTAGLTVSFLNESGDIEKWEFSGGSWAVSGFSQVGAEKFTELENRTKNLLNETDSVYYNTTSYTSIDSKGNLGTGIWKVYSFPISKGNVYDVHSSMLSAPGGAFARAVLSKGTTPVKVLAVGDGSTKLYEQTFEVDIDADTLYVLGYLNDIPTCGLVTKEGLAYMAEKNKSAISKSIDDIRNIENELNNSGLKQTGEDVDNELTEYTSISSDGNLAKISVWKVYSFPIINGKWYHVKSNMITAPNSSFARAVLSKGTTPVKVLAVGDGSTKLYEQTFEVDVDADTLYVLGYLNDIPTCEDIELSLKDSIENLNNKIEKQDVTIGNVDNLETSNKENLVSAINEVARNSNSLVLKNSYTEIITKKYSDISWSDGWWNGLEIAGAGSHTEAIPVKAGDILKFRTKSINDSKESVLVLVDEDNSSPAKKALVKSTSIDFTDYEYQMEENGYVSIGGYFTSSQQAQFQLTIIRFNNLKKLYQEVSQNRVDIDYIKSSDDLKLSPLSDNPLEKIKYEAGMTSIFNTWGFVADSLGSGETAVNVFGQVKRKDLYEYSWGQKLCKICGVEGYNFSYGGQTAKGWIEDISSERAWGYAKNNPKQAYINALGVNDLTHIDREEYAVGDVTTDIGEYYAESDTDTNAKTFVGYYAGIIQRLKSVSPRCRIFCSTIPNGTGQLDSLNDAIRQIVTKFDNVYLIDIKKYNTDKKIYNMASGTYLNDHYSALGYLLIAYMYCTYIDWIIRKNPMDFIDVARIMYSDEEIRGSWTL